MKGRAVSTEVDEILGAQQPFLDALLGSGLLHLAEDPEACDFLAGNPQEIASPEYVEALRRAIEPKDKHWFAYKMMDPAAQRAAAEGLSRELRIQFEPEDIILARGAHGALWQSLKILLERDDEVVYMSPPWFFYEAIILGAGGKPVRVRVRQEDFDLDLEAIREAITARTRVVLINTPNNPTGRIYPPETLDGLAQVLTEASERNGRPIYVLSDEAYSRILFDGNLFHSPGRYYPWSLLVHTYSKSALAPGQRLGYVALPPAMPDREAVRMAYLAVMFATGGGLPDAAMQYALPDIDKISIDLGLLQKKRDHMAGALREMGYDFHIPQATFYLLVKSPIPDDADFAASLARDKVLVLPGRAFEMPGYFRISLTATEDMIERSLPYFAAAAG